MSENTDQPFDGKTLWNVTIEIEAVVLAKERHEAERIAYAKSREIASDIDRGMISASPTEITVAGKKRWSYPDEWDDVEPLGDNEGMTCSQIIAAIEQHRQTHPTATELEAAGQGVLEGCK